MEQDEWEKECQCDYFVSEEKSRNRQEKREIWSTSELEWLPQKELWKDLKSIACVRSTRIINAQTSVELRYYITSLEANAEKVGKGVRSH